MTPFALTIYTATFCLIAASWWLDVAKCKDFSGGVLAMDFILLRAIAGQCFLRALHSYALSPPAKPGGRYPCRSRRL